jgi:hypothetical protein
MVSRGIRCALLVSLALAFLSIAVAQDKKDETKKDDPAPKAKLPVHWAKLGLSDKQKQDYYEVYAKHHKVIVELEKKLADEKAALKTDEDKILTEEQKKQLKAILLKEPVDKDKDKDEKKDK